MKKQDKEDKEQPKLTIERATQPEKAVVDNVLKPGENSARETSTAKKVGEGPKDNTRQQGTEEEEAPSLKEIIREQATEDESPLAKNFTLRKILGGDILTTSTIRRQIWLFMLITFFVIIYISNRYSYQKDLIEMDKLNTELQDAKYRALSSNSQLTERCRESHVLELLQNNKDSVLHIASQPPYIIEVPQ
jgi:hypothetical protein